MRIAILLFDGLTALDAVGPYEILSFLPSTQIHLVGERRGHVRAHRGGLGLMVDTELGELTDPDIIVVPGGPGQTALMGDGPVHQWLRTADTTSTWTTSVCTGSLILAAAGLLEGRRATSHWLALEQLPDHGTEPTGERVVIDGKYVTAAGVSAGIDMALTLSGRVAGHTTAQSIQLGTEYDPRPPYDAGAPHKAPAEIVRAMRDNSRFILHGR